jgi:hypothetical protein
MKAEGPARDAGTASPLTINRAATAVVRSRIHLERAEEELRLALRILAEGPIDTPSLDPPERLALMQRLERYVGKVHALQDASRTVWRHDASWWSEPRSTGEG